MNDTSLPHHADLLEDAMPLQVTQLLRRIDALEQQVAQMRMAEKELVASAEMWRSLVESSPDFMAIVDRTLTLRYLNRAVAGLDVQKMIDTNLCHYVEPEFHDALKESNDCVFQTGQQMQIEIRGIGPHGTSAWYSCRLGPVVVDAQIVSVMHIVTDITERKLAEEALRESEAKNRALLDAIPDLMFRIHRDGTFLEFVPAKELEPIVPPSEFLGRTIFEIMPFTVAQQSMYFVEQTLKSGKLHEFEYQLSLQGGVHDYEARIVVSGEDEVLVLVHDITQRRLAEHLARASEQRFRKLFENAPICILEVDLTQNPPLILAVNRRTEIIYGRPSAAFTALPLIKIFAADAVDDLDRLLARIKTGQVGTLESYQLRDDGSIFPARIRATPDAKARTERMIVTIEDITTEKQRRSIFEALDEDRRRIAHEIHDGLAQNLAALRLKTTLWHDLVDANPEQMHDELDNLLALLKTNISEVRRSIFALRPIILDELSFVPALRQFLDFFDEHYPVRTELQITGSEERMPASLELPLFRILQESLHNIGQHAQAKTASIYLDLTSTDALLLTIRDDGIGFDPTILAQSPQVEHLGLQTMRERVESFGGILLVESRTGEGTEMQVTLPLTAA